jgi:hypothetical protein
VEDYIEQIYAGTIAVAQADPFIAAAGAGVSTELESSSNMTSMLKEPQVSLCSA